tara:strand:+ start:10530 stop:11273 length:744 start_codon:yes stop_codon:yes gene_type:complete
MSTDIPNNYLHNLIQDSSNNLQNRFVNLLVEYLNNQTESENLLNLPFQNRINSFQNILNNSLMEKKAYKKVISDKGKDKLKEIIYDDTKFETKECVISMDEFNNGDKIIQLPCTHIFHKKSIKTWLCEESSKCPVCRYELDYKEVKNIENNENIIIDNVDASRNRVNQMLENMNFIYNPTQYIHRPSRVNFVNETNNINRIFEGENQYLMNRNLQNAILASINTNDYYDSDSSNEDIDIFESFTDDY